MLTYIFTLIVIAVYAYGIRIIWRAFQALKADGLSTRVCIVAFVGFTLILALGIFTIINQQNKELLKSIEFLWVLPLLFCFILIYMDARNWK